MTIRPPLRPIAEAIFLALDQNHDGRIGAYESGSVTARRDTKIWEYNKNDDGGLSREELATVLNSFEHDEDAKKLASQVKNQVEYKTEVFVPTTDALSPALLNALGDVVGTEDTPQSYRQILRDKFLTRAHAVHKSQTDPLGCLDSEGPGCNLLSRPSVNVRTGVQTRRTQK